MKRPLCLLVVLSSLFIFCPSFTWAQKRRQRPQKPAAKYDPKPFNNAVEDLPPQYIGNPYFEVLVALRARQKIAGKGEFESTIDYKARVERLNSRPLVGSLTFNNLLAFSFYPDGGQFKVSYDADLTSLDAVFNWKRFYAAGSYDDPVYALTWYESSRRVGAYDGRNAFNVSRRIQVYRNDDYYLGAAGADLEWLLDAGRDAGPQEGERPRRLPYDRRESPLRLGYELPVSMSVLMPPSEARISKGNLRALVVCWLAEKPLYQDNDRDTPEITDPYDRFNFQHVVLVVPEEIWFYDLPSGRVYAKHKYRPEDESAPVEAGTSGADGKARREGSGRTYREVEVNVKARILSRPEPLYTEEARKNQVSGTVVLRAVFSASGQVTDIRVVSGLPHGLTEKAMEAARQIRFTPAMKDGRAVSQYTQIEYNFNLY
jgi:TonB family protein